MKKKAPRNQLEFRVEQVNKTFQQSNVSVEVFKNISCSFQHNLTYALTGVSGSGKSTFLWLLAGLDAPTYGKIFYHNENIHHFNAHKKNIFLNQELGLVFQRPYMINELSVLENVMLKGMIIGKPLQYCRQEALELLQQVGIYDKRDAAPVTLSGGQQQRVAIARALFGKPAFLLVDEPTAHLDTETTVKIIDLILDCQKKWNTGLIMSSHDMQVADRMDIVLKLQNGRLYAKNINHQKNSSGWQLNAC